MTSQFPATDPTPIFELFRGMHATELLTAAVAHFQLFERLAAGPVEAAALQQQLELAERPFVVLTTALRAMGLLTKIEGKFALTPIAREHLLSNAAFDVAGYVGLAANHPGVLGMVERLKTNRPQGTEDDTAAKDSPDGTAFIFREGTTSAMDQEQSARQLTLSLAGRARNVAPYLAKRVDLRGEKTLLDVGGGSGIYAFELLRANPQLQAILIDRAEVLKVAAELFREWGVEDRVKLCAGDMFTAEYPHQVDVVLLSNILHDWDVPECGELVQKAAAALKPGGRLLIHDVYLNDELDGPLPIALYSASLFTLTEGRAYSAAEYRNWLTAAGLESGEIVPTLVHCGVLTGTKR